MKELVSVIIPFYNEEQYIGDCLISLIKQTYKNIEIICVDDGSTDKGAMIVKAIQQSDSRISLIQQENMNAGTARNVGFSKAKGEYVLFLDSDDFFSPLMVERMLNKALSTNSDIVFCTGYGLNVITKETYMMPPVGKDNASFPNKEVFSSADTTDGIFQLSVTWAWDKMNRTDFIRKNDIFFQGTKVCNDLVFVCLSYLFGERITSVNQHFICHRTNIACSILNTVQNGSVKHSICYVVDERVYFMRFLRRQLVSNEAVQSFFCTCVFFIDQQSAVKVQAYVFHHIFQNVHRLTSL